MKFVMTMILLTGMSFAQKEDLNARDPRLNEGQLFTIRFTPAAKKISVGLAGSTQAEMSPGKVILMGREVTHSGKERQLSIKPSGDQFEIAEPLTSGQKLEIEVRDRKDQSKKEVFKLDVP